MLQAFIRMADDSPYCYVSLNNNYKVGGDVWCAALLLSAWLLENPEVVRGLDVLELGSGLGLCGITAGYLAKGVTLTGRVRLCFAWGMVDSGRSLRRLLLGANCFNLVAQFVGGVSRSSPRSLSRSLSLSLSPGERKSLQVSSRTFCVRRATMEQLLKTC